MSDIQTSNNVGLTAYNVEGLELFFTSNRKVRASQSAIARMCSTGCKPVAQGQIRQFVTKASYLKNDVVPAEALTLAGLRSHLLYGADVIVACLENYNPKRLKDFMRFGVDEGLAQMAGVPVVTVTPVATGYQIPDNVAILEIALQLAKEDRNRQNFLSDKPGLKTMDDNAKQDRTLALPAGKFILKELAVEMSLELSIGQLRGLSGMLTNAVLTQNLQAPTKRLIKGKRKQGYYVNEYSYDVKSVAVDCMKHMNLI